MDTNQDRVVKVHAEVMELRRGGGCAALFGAPFFASGVLLVLGAAGRIPLESGEPLPLWGRALVGLMSLAFLGVGLWLMLGRSGARLDKSMSSVVVWKRLLIWKREERHDLGGFERVGLIIKHGDSDTADTYHVDLEGAVKSARLHTSPDYMEARRASAAVARFLSLPLQNRTSAQTETLTPEELELPFSQRLKEDPQKIPELEGSLPSSVMVKQGKGWAEIVIAQAGLRWYSYITTAVPVTVYIFLCWHFKPWLDATHTPPFVQLVIYLVMGTFLVVAPLAGLLNKYLLSLYGKTEIKVDANAIEVQERTAMRRRSSRLSVERVLELSVVQPEYPSHDKPTAPSGLQARTEDQTVTIAGRIDLQTALYIRAIILNAIAG